MNSENVEEHYAYNAKTTCACGSRYCEEHIDKMIHKCIFRVKQEPSQSSSSGENLNPLMCQPVRYHVEVTGLEQIQETDDLDGTRGTDIESLRDQELIMRQTKKYLVK